METESTMKALIKNHDTCVMATVSAMTPHCSLMCYDADDECRELFMMTRKETKKYRNLEENGRVSLLIDTRTDGAGSVAGNVRALTVAGTFRQLPREKQKDVLARMLARFPHLEAIARAEDVEVFAVVVSSMQLLDGVTKSSFANTD
jgi:uncharacterized protein YhbP (UPF0306 family)